MVLQLFCDLDSELKQRKTASCCQTRSYLSECVSQHHEGCLYLSHGALRTNDGQYGRKRAQASVPACLSLASFSKLLERFCN